MYSPQSPQMHTYMSEASLPWYQVSEDVLTDRHAAIPHMMITSPTNPRIAGLGRTAISLVIGIASCVTQDCYAAIR
jgi:hypothetical protein